MRIRIFTSTVAALGIFAVVGLIAALAIAWPNLARAHSSVTAEDSTTDEEYTVSINRGVTDDYGWKAVADLDGLLAAGNADAQGIWSDDTTIWVADFTDAKVYSYNMLAATPPTVSNVEVTSTLTNNPATGTPTLIGPLRVGEVLRVDTSSIEDLDGLTSPSFSYTWLADDDLLEPGAFLRALSIVNEYEVAPYDVGMTIKVEVYFDDDKGNSESFDVQAISTVAAVAPDPPGNLNASLGDPGELDLSWSTPAVCDFTLVFDCWLDLDRAFSVGDGGSEITGYTVQWKLASGSWGVASHVSEAEVTTTSYTVTRLSASSTYTVRVLARNAVGAGTPSTEVTVSGTDLNVGPVVSGRAMPTFFETNPRNVATYTAADPESDTITWSLSGADANFFSIANGVLNFDFAGDFEDPRDVGANNAYDVNIHAFDGDNTATFHVTVVIGDVDESPAISGDDTLTFAENTETATVLHTYGATDPEGVTSFTWSLAGTDSGDFEISTSGEVTFKNVPDYDSPADSGGNNEYNIQVRAYDGRRTGTLDVTITVTDECTSAGEPPCAPGRPGVSSESDTSLRATWSTPRTPSGTSITGYDLQHRESESGGSWISQSVAGTDRSHTIENLIKDTTYEVQVRAMNDSSGYGEWSLPGTGTPGYVPPPPSPTRSSGGSSGGSGGGGRSRATPTPTPTPSPTPTATPTPTGPQFSGVIAAEPSVTATVVPDEGTTLGLNGGGDEPGGVYVNFPPTAVALPVHVSVSVSNEAPSDVAAPSGTTLLPMTIDITPETPLTLDEPLTIEINPTPKQLEAAGGDLNNLSVGVVTPNGIQVLPAQVMHGRLVVTTDRIATFVLLAVTDPGPVLTQPPMGDASSMGPLLQWTQPPRTTWFQVQVIPFNEDGPGINLVIGDSAQVRAAQYQVMAPNFGSADPNYVLLPDMTYLWRVRTTTVLTNPTEADWSAWAVSSFKTPPASSSTITPVSPPAFAEVGTLTPTLTWANSNTAVFYYEVQVSRDFEFGPNAFLYSEYVHGGASTPLNSYVVPEAFPLEAGEIYYWRVRPRIQGDGDPLPWSATYVFLAPG